MSFQVIHVAIVCAGYKETRRVVTLIKSILFYRKQPLHFHFVSDEPGQHVLKVLFETWKLQKGELVSRLRLPISRWQKPIMSNPGGVSFC